MEFADPESSISSNQIKMRVTRDFHVLDDNPNQLLECVGLERGCPACRLNTLTPKRKSVLLRITAFDLDKKTITFDVVD